MCDWVSEQVAMALKVVDLRCRTRDNLLLLRLHAERSFFLSLRLSGL